MQKRIRINNFTTYNLDQDIRANMQCLFVKHLYVSHSICKYAMVKHLHYSLFIR